MKRTLILFGVALFLVLFTSLMSAQTTIPNAGFESWTGTNPNSWATSNAGAGFDNITKSATAHSGSSSARGDVISISPVVQMPMVPMMQSGPGGTGFPYILRSASLTLYYQFSPLASSGDRLAMTVLLTKGSLTGTAVAVGAANIGNAASSWQQLTIPLVYNSPQSPDTCYIQIMIIGPPTGSQPKIGSYFLIDDLAFSGNASAVGNESALPNSFALEQNYPNPFNPSTNIRFSVAQAGHVSLKVYNVLGVEVASIVNEQKEAGTFSVNWNASGLPSGMYLYRLSVTSDKGQLFDQTKKLALLK
jgi:hypothetical protein